MSRWGFLLVLCSAAAAAGEADRVFQDVAGSVVTIEVKDESGEPTGQGSGVVVAAESVATNCHVLVEGDAFTVASEQRQHAARWTLRAPARDLCLLKVPGLAAKPARSRSSAGLAAGEPVYAVGNPLGFGLSISSGHVAALPVHRDGGAMIVTTAQISPGSSGGGLFDSEGRLIGITTAVVNVAQSLNFAIPAEAVAALLKDGTAPPPPPAPAPPEPRWVDEIEALRVKGAWLELEALTRRYLTLYPDATYARVLLAIALANQRKLAAARQVLNEAVALDVNDAYALAQRAHVLMQQGELNAAARDIRQALIVQAARAHYHSIHADILAQQKKYAEQLAAATRATELEPLNAGAWRQVGGARISLKQSDAAIEALRIAVKIDPNDAQARSLLATLLADQGKLDEARGQVSASPIPAEHDPYVWLKLGEQAWASGRMLDAEQAYRKALVPGAYYVQAAAGLAAVLMRTERVDEAEKLLEQALAREPDQVALLQMSARVHLTRKQYDRAAAMYEALAKRPEVVANSRSAAEMWREMGYLYLLQGNQSKAAHAYGETVARDPSRPQDWAELCLARVQSGDKAGAEAACQKAVAMDPRSERALLATGQLYGLRGEYSKSLEYLERALAVNGASSQAMSSKGYTLMQAGRVAEAVPVLETAVRLEPDSTNALTNLGQAYLRSNQPGKAIQTLGRAVQLAPKARDARVYLTQSYVATRQTKQALAQADQLRKIAPDSAAALYAGALAGLSAGDRQRALADYQKLKGVSPPMAREIYQISRQPGMPVGVSLPE